MTTFENQDTEYLKWLENHEHGYVLNRRDSPADTYMVHTARCSHIYYPKGDYTHTVKKNKMCSDRLEELQAWANGKGFAVVECTTCKPYK